MRGKREEREQPAVVYEDERRKKNKERKVFNDFLLPFQANNKNSEPEGHDYSLF